MKQSKLILSLITIDAIVFIFSLSATINNIQRLEGSINNTPVCNTAANGGPCYLTSNLWAYFTIMILTAGIMGLLAAHLYKRVIDKPEPK